MEHLQWKSKLNTWKKRGVRPNSNEPPCIRHCNVVVIIVLGRAFKWGGGVHALGRIGECGALRHWRMS